MSPLPSIPKKRALVSLKCRLRRVLLTRRSSSADTIDVDVAGSPSAANPVTQQPLPSSSSAAEKEDKDFRARRQELEEYTRALLAVPILVSSSPAMREFFAFPVAPQPEQVLGELSIEKSLSISEDSGPCSVIVDGVVTPCGDNLLITSASGIDVCDV